MTTLTRQALEELGWVYSNGFYYGWKSPDFIGWDDNDNPVKMMDDPNTTQCDEISNRDLSWRLNWQTIENYLKIECYERNSFDWETCYMGPCPSKEQLQIIMHWFKLIK